MTLLLSAVQDAEQLSEKHVGNHKGSCKGYNNAYIPTVELKQPHEWLGVHIVADDFIDTIKLTMESWTTMRAKWDNANGGLALYTNTGWVRVGWVEELKFGKGFRQCSAAGSKTRTTRDQSVETENRADVALKAAATVAIIGGFHGHDA